jgi:hypothetical protein
MPELEKLRYGKRKTILQEETRAMKLILQEEKQDRLKNLEMLQREEELQRNSLQAQEMKYRSQREKIEMEEKRNIRAGSAY